MIMYLQQHFKTNNLKDLDFLFNCQIIDFNYYKQNELETLLLYKLYNLLALRTQQVKKNKAKRKIKCQLNPDILSKLKDLRLCISCSLRQQFNLYFDQIQIHDSITGKDTPLQDIIKSLIVQYGQPIQQIKDICQIYQVYRQYRQKQKKFSK